jgi:GDP-4-dehydro-6-deoxy-D-mannose reductase
VTVLVTGAAGFVGQWLTRSLLERDETVFGLSMTGQPAPSVLTQKQIDSVTWLSGDLRSAEDVDTALETARPDAIYHLAAVSHIPQAAADSAAAFDVNTLGAVRLLNAVGRHSPKGTNRTRTLVVGSGEQYGVHPAKAYPLSEEAAQHPITVYAASKAAQEIVALTAARGQQLEVIATRSFTHSGPGQDERFLLPSLVKRVARLRKSGSSELPLGNMTPVRDFLHVADVVNAYITLCEGADSGQVFNVCSGEGRTVRQVAETVLRIGGVRAVPKSDPKLMRPADLPMLVGDNSKLRATGWEPAFTFDDMVTDLWNHAS